MLGKFFWLAKINRGPVANSINILLSVKQDFVVLNSFEKLGHGPRIIKDLYSVFDTKCKHIFTLIDHRFQIISRTFLDCPHAQIKLIEMLAVFFFIGNVKPGLYFKQGKRIRTYSYNIKYIYCKMVIKGELLVKKHSSSSAHIQSTRD